MFSFRGTYANVHLCRFGLTHGWAIEFMQAAMVDVDRELARVQALLEPNGPIMDEVAEQALDRWCAEHRPAERRKPIARHGKMAP